MTTSALSPFFPLGTSVICSGASISLITTSSSARSLPMTLVVRHDHLDGFLRAGSRRIRRDDRNRIDSVGLVAAVSLRSHLHVMRVEDLPIRGVALVARDRQPRGRRAAAGA